MSDAKNQCMGCRGRWKLMHARHAVDGGYPHELVSCTAGRYVEAEMDTLRARLAECERERDVAVTEAEIRRLALLVAIGERDTAIQRAEQAEGKLRETTYAALAAREQGEADTVAGIANYVRRRDPAQVPYPDLCASIADRLESYAWRGKEGGVMWTVMITFGGRRDGRPATRVGERAWVGRFKSRRLAEAAAESWRTDPVFAWTAESVRVAREPVVTRPPRRRTPVRMVGSWRGAR